MKKILIFLSLTFFITSCQLMYKDTVTIKITDKERVTQRTSDGTESKYLIFTEKETFENTDYLLVGKFNSSDIYGKLNVGETYTFKVGGKRIPFLSMYRNIHEVIK